jgi:hypothetical protein
MSHRDGAAGSLQIARANEVAKGLRNQRDFELIHAVFAMRYGLRG